MAQFQLEIMTPDGVKFSGACDSLLVRTDAGDVEILRGHADYFAAVSTGRARLLIDGRSRFASASGGFLSVESGVVRFAPVTFEFAEDIDERRAMAAKERAEAQLAAARDEKAAALAKAKLLRALSRLNIANMR